MAPKNKQQKKHHKMADLLHIGKAKGKKESSEKKKDKSGSKFSDFLKAGGKKLQEKMKTRGAVLEAKMKKKSEEVREKMKTKGNELRKRMKEKMHEKSIEMKKKMKETSAEMKKRMRDKGHELKERMKEGGKDIRTKLKAQDLLSKGMELSADMKKRLMATGDKLKHMGNEWETELSKESTADVTSKLVTWRQTFEDKGWAVGKVYNDWATLMLMGLNVFSVILALVVLGVSVNMASKFKRQCLTFLLTPAVTIGFLFSLLLFAVSVAGFLGVWFNRLNIVKIHFFATVLLVGMLFSFTVYGFNLTSRGKGTKLPDGISFKKYQLTAYSRWLQRKVNDTVHWARVRSCISSGPFCKNWTTNTPEEVYAAKFSSTQLGCCAPPFECGYAYKGATVWMLPSTPAADPDCTVWDSAAPNATSFCLDCMACKAGVLHNVKSMWYKASVVNMVVIAALIVIVFRTWFVMRVTGRWDSVAATVKSVVKPEKKEEEKPEVQSVIDIGEPVHEEEEEHEPEKDDDDAHEDEEETPLVPAWLEEDVPPDEIPKSSAGSEDSAAGGSSRKKKAKRKKVKRPTETPADEAASTSEEPSTPRKSKKEKKVRMQAAEEPAEDDSWASPRQQTDPAAGYFPQGFLAQNPLTAMSPWLQSPEAGYVGAQYYGGQPSYMQPEYLLHGQEAPVDYNMQAYYQGDPYGQMAGGYDPNVQGYMQQQDPSYGGMYMQDPMQQYQQQMYMQEDPMMQQQMYMEQQQQQQQQQQDPSQFYMQQYMEDPSQAYMQQQQQQQQDPNQVTQFGYQTYSQYYNQGWPYS